MASGDPTRHRFGAPLPAIGLVRMPTPPLLIAHHVLSGRHVLALRGELDEDTGRDLRGAIDELVAGGTRAVTLDLRGLEYLDSGGLHALAAIDDALGRSGGGASFVAAAPHLHRLFGAVGLQDLAFVDPA